MHNDINSDESENFIPSLKKLAREKGINPDDFFPLPGEPTSGCYGTERELRIKRDKPGSGPLGPQRGDRESDSELFRPTSPLSQILFELDGRIYAYESAIKAHYRAARMSPEDWAVQERQLPPHQFALLKQAKRSPIELAVMESNLALMKQHKSDALRIYRAGVSAVTVNVNLRFCPDCPEKTRKPLPFRHRYCPKHRAQRRRKAKLLSQREARLKTVKTVTPPHTLTRRDDMKKKMGEPSPDEGIKRQIIGLMQAEKLGLYAAAKKLGIVKQQVNHWLYKDEWFRLRARHERILETTELLLKALELRHTERPLTDREQAIVDLTNPLFENPAALDSMLSLEDPVVRIRQMTVREMQAFDRELEKARKSNRHLRLAHTGSSTSSPGSKALFPPSGPDDDEPSNW